MKPDSHREAAVEAAAKRHYAPVWGQLTPAEKEECREFMRPVLDAARPHERAAFMEELAERLLDPRTLDALFIAIDQKDLEDIIRAAFESIEKPNELERTAAFLRTLPEDRSPALPMPDAFDDPPEEQSHED